MADNKKTIYNKSVLKYKTDISQIWERVKITKVVDKKGDLTLRFENILPTELRIDGNKYNYQFHILDDIKNDPNYYVDTFSLNEVTEINKIKLERVKFIFVDKYNKEDVFYAGSINSNGSVLSTYQPAKSLLFGNKLRNVILAGDYDSVIYCSGIDNIIHGGSQKDLIYASNGTDYILGDSGNDKIQGFAGDDFINGGNGADSIWGGTGNDWLLGGEQKDHIEGNKGDDFINGEEDDDFLYGGEGNDVIFGGDGNDLIFGDNNNYDDGSYCENKDEITRLGFGYDILVGGKGDDTLVGGKGSDFLYGGEGNDNYEFYYGDGANVITEVAQLIEEFNGKKEYCNALIFRDHFFDELKVSRHGSHMLITSLKKGDNLSVLVKDQLNGKGPKVKWLMVKINSPSQNNQLKIILDNIFFYRSPDLGKITNKEITEMLTIEDEFTNYQISSVTSQTVHGKNYNNTLAMLKQLMANTQKESLSVGPLISFPNQKNNCSKNIIAPSITQ